MSPLDIALASPESIALETHISAITQLVLAERECRDLGRWDRMKSCFHPDGQVRISWFQGNTLDFVDASREMARRGVLAKHRLGPVAVRVNALRAVATLAAIIEIPAEVRGVAVMLSSHARLFYRAEMRDGEWRLGSFEVFYMRDELWAQIPGEVVPVHVIRAGPGRLHRARRPGRRGPPGDGRSTVPRDLRLGGARAVTLLPG
jgi:SnoaL-like domain